MYFFDGRIRYSEVDSKGKLTLTSLLDYFQDTSTFHSEDLGMGVEYLAKIHQVWLLSSWQIVVDRYPRLGERVRIGTAPYAFKNFMGSRNFAMLSENGEFLAKANSVWSLMDTDTWRPVLPSREMLEGYVLEPGLDMDYAPRKIAIPEGGEDREGILIRKHHLDTNNHVNNGRYVDMAMEYLPADFVIRQMRAEYKMQTHLNDILIPHVVESGDCVIVALNDDGGKVHATVEFLREVNQ